MAAALASATTTYGGVSRRVARLSLTAALTLHAAAAGMLLASWARGLGVGGVGASAPRPAAGPVNMVDLPAEADGMPAVGVDPADVWNMLRERVGLTGETATTGSLDRYDRMADRVRLASVEEIAGLLGVDSDTHQPRVGDDGGTFDTASMSIQNITPVRHPEKGEGYLVVCVDKRGRTLPLKVYGEQARVYDAAASAFRRINSNPVLGAMYHRIVKQITPGLADEVSEAVPDPPRPAPPPPDADDPGSRKAISDPPESRR